MSTFHPAGIFAVARRQLSSLLGNPVGYLFILAFVLATAAVLSYWGDYRWFVRNIADLAPLHAWMPWLLVVLLPALAMNAWASEREQGTEELLLTLPLSPADALLGKFLAIAGFFTLALLATSYNVIELYIQGSPDTGLVLANYLGWWLAGLVAGALALLASVLVSSVPIAFVIGLAFCAIVVGHRAIIGAGASLLTWLSGHSLDLSQTRIPDWFDAFNRGLVPLGHIAIAVAVVAVVLAIAVLALSARRWRPQRAGQAWSQVASIALGLLLAVHLGVIGSRYGVRQDLTSERLLSLAPASRAMLRDGLNDSVVVTIAMSQRVPPELEAKEIEVRSKIEALKTANPSRITVQWLRPADETDADGVRAKNEFGIQPRTRETDTIAGRESVQVFLGAHIANGARTQVIEHFDPGLSVEYELLQGIRSVTIDVKQRKRLGIAITDLDLLGEAAPMNPMMMQRPRAWAVVDEWRRQYDVQAVNLDQPIDEKLDALVVPQLSSLPQPQLERVHDWVWKGHPTLIIDDPLPIFEVAMGRRDDLMPGRPKRSPRGPMGEDGGGGPPKGDTTPLYNALGLSWDNRKLLYSEHNPSHYFRANQAFRQFALVWTDRTQGSFPNASPAVDGIPTAMFPAPGGIRKLEGSGAVGSLTFTGLVRPVKRSPWVINTVEEIYRANPMTGQQELNPDLSRSEPDDVPAFIAVQITGTMPSAYPRLDAVQSELAAKADAAKPAEGQPAPAKPEAKAGIIWSQDKPINVLVVADADFIANPIFAWYNGQGLDDPQMKDNVRFLRDLRNIQFSANLIDTLVNDQALLALRTRFPEPRPLKRLEAVRMEGGDKLREKEEGIKRAVTDKIAKLNADIQRDLDAINADQTLDHDQKIERLAKNAEQKSRVTEVEIAREQLEQQVQIAKARSDMRRDYESAIDRVRTRLLLIPSILLLALVAIVWLNRRAAERAHIPTARKRSSP